VGKFVGDLVGLSVRAVQRLADLSHRHLFLSDRPVHSLLVNSLQSLGTVGELDMGKFVGDLVGLSVRAVQRLADLSHRHLFLSDRPAHSLLVNSLQSLGTVGEPDVGKFVGDLLGRWVTTVHCP